MLSLSDLRAYADEYGATFDERLTDPRLFDLNRFFGWLEKRMAEQSGEAVTHAEAQAAVAEMTPAA